MTTAPDTTKAATLAANRAIRHARADDPRLYESWNIMDFAACTATAAIEADRLELAKQGYVLLPKERVRDAIECAIFTALVAETTGEDDDEWLDLFVRPRVEKWTAEIMKAKLSLDD